MRVTAILLLLMLLLPACDDPTVIERRPLGAPCDGALDCASGFCVGQDAGWLAGMCSADCAQTACPADSACVTLGLDAICVPTCDNDAPCRQGYACYAGGYCLPECGTGWSCGEGWTCEADGTCAAAAIGEACEASSQCASGLCMPEVIDGEETHWPGGMCMSECSDPCPEEASCVEDCPEDARCTTLNGRSWCLPVCLNLAPCREGYVCSWDTEVCLPDCRLGWDCGEDLECKEDGQCDPPGALSGGPIGKPCTDDGDCDELICLELAPPQGRQPPPGRSLPSLCTRPCTMDDPLACPDHAACAPFPGQGEYCTQRCDQQPCAPFMTCNLSEVCIPKGP